MIDRLKYLIDASENNPVHKELFLTVAKLKEENQEQALKLIEAIVNNLNTKEVKKWHTINQHLNKPKSF